MARIWLSHTCTWKRRAPLCSVQNVGELAAGVQLMFRAYKNFSFRIAYTYVTIAEPSITKWMIPCDSHVSTVLKSDIFVGNSQDATATDLKHSGASPLANSGEATTLPTQIPRNCEWSQFS